MVSTWRACAPPKREVLPAPCAERPRARPAGSYYIEVFSKAYRTQFEGDIAARRRAAFESLGAPTRPQPLAPPAAVGAATTGAAVALKKQE